MNTRKQKTDRIRQDPLTREVAARIREAHKAGLSFYKLRKLTGVNMATIGALTLGIRQGTITLDTAQRLLNGAGAKLIIVDQKAA